MSSRFEQAYRVDGATKLTATLWNRIFRELDTRLVSIEEKKASFEEAERQLLQIGLDRINEALLPAAERIFRVAELGFLVASSDEEATFVEGQEASLTIREGDQRELFTPTEFVAISRRSTPEDWVIARTLGYSRESGVLLVRAEVVKGSGGPHDDWDVSATPGAAQAVVDLFEQVSSLRQEVADDKAAVAIDKAAAQSARTEAQNARDAAIIAKTGAESALASFMTVYRGALPSAPPDGEQGHFYFDTTLQMARVYTASGWEPLFQVSLGGIRQGFFEAVNGQDDFTVPGGFTYLNVWVNGVLLTPGVDYTTASPDVTLAAPLSAGDQVAYTGYYATEVTDFYSKFDADARFVRYDDTQGLSGEQQAQARANINAANADDILTDFVQGLTLSNNADDPNNKINIAPGRARGNGVTVVNPAVLTITLGAGRQPNTAYHVHALRNDATGEFAATFGLSATSPSIPAGYTRVQRLGAIMTDGSGNIRPFVQDGNEFRYAVSGGNGVSAYGSVVGNRAYSLLSCPVPTGVRLKLLLLVTLAALSTPNPQDGGEAIFGDGANQLIRVHIHRWGVDGNTGAGIYFWTMDPVSVRTNTSGQINFGIQSAHGSYGSQLWVRGWVDESIPRIGK